MSEARPKLYLLDVEGTISPLALTTEVLFPYARAHFEEFLWRMVPGPEGTFWWDVMMLFLENRAETDPNAPHMLPDFLYDPAFKGDPNVVSMSPAKGIPRILKYIYWLMDHDRKSTALKSLQGKIWKAGFESGELKGTLFADVPGALARWSELARVAIYSSGSTEAQQLLFRYSTFGDLTPLIAGYFDTRIGAKASSASYTEIAQSMSIAPAELLFFSDVVRELDAAREAGCQTRLVIRPGNPPIENLNGHSSLESFVAL